MLLWEVWLIKLILGLPENGRFGARTPTQINSFQYEVLDLGTRLPAHRQTRSSANPSNSKMGPLTLGMAQNNKAIVPQVKLGNIYNGGGAHWT